MLVASTTDTYFRPQQEFQLRLSFSHAEGGKKSSNLMKAWLLQNTASATFGRQWPRKTLRSKCCSRKFSSCFLYYRFCGCHGCTRTRITVLWNTGYLEILYPAHWCVGICHGNKLPNATLSSKMEEGQLPIHYWRGHKYCNQARPV